MFGSNFAIFSLVLFGYGWSQCTEHRNVLLDRIVSPAWLRARTLVFDILITGPVFINECVLMPRATGSERRRL